MADTKEIAGFDPSKYAEAIRSKIQAEVVGLIPNEQWTQMITAEVKRFTEPTITSARWDARETKVESPLQALVRTAIEAKFREMLAGELDGILATTWDGFSNQRSDALKKLVAEAAPAVFNNMMTSLVESAIVSLRSSGRF